MTMQLVNHKARRVRPGQGKSTYRPELPAVREFVGHDLPSTRAKVCYWYGRGYSVEALSRQFGLSTALIYVIVGGESILADARVPLEDGEEERTTEDTENTEHEKPRRELRSKEPLKQGELLTVLRRRGTVFLSQIAKHVGRPTSTVSDALQRLIRAEQVRRVAIGSYEAVPVGEQESAE